MPVDIELLQLRTLRVHELRESEKGIRPRRQ